MVPKGHVLRITEWALTGIERFLYILDLLLLLVKNGKVNILYYILVCNDDWNKDICYKKYWWCLLTFHYAFIHSTGMCRIRRFIAGLRSFFHSSLLCTFSCHPSPSSILPPSLTPSSHLFLGLPLNLLVPKFIYNTLFGILFPSILCTFPNQRNLFNLIFTNEPMGSKNGGRLRNFAREC